jgi:hypothetical protein
MILDRVTITGADDSVTPKDLETLSAEFPFVEWGILFSPKRQGGPLFPTADWVRSLDTVDGLKLCAHLCGSVMRATLEGHPDWWLEWGLLTPMFRRVQLNFHAEPQESIDIARLRKFTQHELIYQCDGINDELVMKIVREIGGAPLFDKSGGAGVLPKDGWPAAWSGIYCGYAGGLGPDNVVEQLKLIEAEVPADGRIWIDMERRVRTDDYHDLDLAKVRSVLKQVEPFVTAEE